MFCSHVCRSAYQTDSSRKCSAGVVVTYEKQSKVNMFICASNASLWRIDLSL